MKYSHIVAVSENNVIGVAGQLPWHISADLKRFKQLTLNHSIIMGRKTFESIGKPLPGRFNIVVTRQTTFGPTSYPGNLLFLSSIEEAFKQCEALSKDWGEEVFIVGGGEIYIQTMPFVSSIYLTKVHKFVEGDTFYPDFSSKLFAEVERQEIVDGDIRVSFITYKR